MDEIYRKVYKAIKRCWEVQQSVHKLDRFTTKLGLEQHNERVLQDYLHRVFEQLNTLETELGIIVEQAEQRNYQHRSAYHDIAPGLSQAWQGTSQHMLRYCTNCGNALAGHGRYCAYCGHPASQTHSNHYAPPGFVTPVPSGNVIDSSSQQTTDTSLIVEGSVDHGSEVNTAQRDVNISYGNSNVVECSACNSEGFVTSYQSCTYCGGEGCTTHVLHPNSADSSEVIEVYGCLHCGGSGMTRMSKGDVESLGYVRGSGYREIRNQCPTCRGHGKVKL